MKRLVRLFLFFLSILWLGNAFAAQGSLNFISSPAAPKHLFFGKHLAKVTKHVEAKKLRKAVVEETQDENEISKNAKKLLDKHLGFVPLLAYIQNLYKLLKEPAKVQTRFFNCTKTDHNKLYIALAVFRI